MILYFTMYLVFYLVNNLFTIYLYVYTLHHIKTKKINHNTFLYISPIFFFHYRKQIHNFCRIHRFGTFCLCVCFFFRSNEDTTDIQSQASSESRERMREEPLSVLSWKSRSPLDNCVDPHYLYVHIIQ